MYELYPYQDQVIRDLRQGFRDGHLRQVLGLATGSGKTVVASHLAHNAAQKGKRVLFIVDRIELVGQAVRHFQDMSLRVGVLRGEDTNYPEKDDIVVASIQTIRSRSAPDWMDVGIIDECHILHQAHIDLMNDWSTTPFIGLSATPLREGMGKYFTRLVRGPSVLWLTENGFLVPVHPWAPGAENIAAVLHEVKAKTTTHGYDFDESALGEAMNRKELIGDIVTTWKDKGEDRQTLCFAVNIAHSKSIADDFSAEGISVAHLDAYTKMAERKEIIRAFRAREIRILSSVNVLGIGFDVPDAACGILARPTLSAMLDAQQKGRVIRPADGKEDAILLDHAGNTLRHGLPIHFELPETLDDGSGDTRAKRKEKRKLTYVACQHCGYVMDPDVVQCPACGIDRPMRRNKVT